MPVVAQSLSSNSPTNVASRTRALPPPSATARRGDAIAKREDVRFAHTLPRRACCARRALRRATRGDRSAADCDPPATRPAARSRSRQDEACADERQRVRDALDAPASTSATATRPAALWDRWRFDGRERPRNGGSAQQLGREPCAAIKPPSEYDSPRRGCDRPTLALRYVRLPAPMSYYRAADRAAPIGPPRLHQSSGCGSRPADRRPGCSDPRSHPPGRRHRLHPTRPWEEAQAVIVGGPLRPCNSSRPPVRQRTEPALPTPRFRDRFLSGEPAPSPALSHVADDQAEELAARGRRAVATGRRDAHTVLGHALHTPQIRATLRRCVGGGERGGLGPAEAIAREALVADADAIELQGVGTDLDPVLVGPMCLTREGSGRPLGPRGDAIHRNGSRSRGRRRGGRRAWRSLVAGSLPPARHDDEGVTAAARSGEVAHQGSFFGF